MNEMKIIGVVGAGQMGAGIAQLAAANGFDVFLLDADPEALTKATKSITYSLQRLVSKGQFTQVFFFF